MANHPIENVIEKTMQSISEMVDVNTIVGDTVTMGDGTLIIPISKVSFGLVAGGGQYTGKQAELPQEFPFSGGGASGAAITPMAFLVVTGNEVKLLSVQRQTPAERILEKMPGVFDAVMKTLEQGKQHEGCN